MPVSVVDLGWLLRDSQLPRSFGILAGYLDLADVRPSILSRFKLGLELRLECTERASRRDSWLDEEALHREFREPPPIRSK